jgi:L-ascorbate metabolism protein UlaG (beta-lactamase superfamily)
MPIGRDLVEEIEYDHSWTPRIWWLGHSGFVIKFHAMIFYVDPCLSEREDRLHPPLFDPAEAGHADMVLATHHHERHMDGLTLNAILQASRTAKLVLPKSAASHAKGLGIPFERMTTTDADLRIEYFKSGDYIRIYAVPSAHPELGWSPIGGYPQLGYLIRCGGITIYHAGDCVPYESIVPRLRPYNVTVAMLPVAGAGNFSIEQASQLAEDIEARWLVPMHYGTFADCAGGSSEFVNHMLFSRPVQRFKVFEPGEGWTIPED